MEPTAVSRAIIGGLVADELRVDALVADVTAWIDAHPEQVAGHHVAWTAARSVDLALVAIAAGAAPRPSADLIRMFRSLPVASQVVVALHDFCGLDDPEVAAETNRPIDEVKRLLDTVGDPQPPPALAVPTPSEAPKRSRQVPTGGRPRWWVIALVVVLALIAAGIAASNLRDDDAAVAPTASGLGDAAAVRRDQLSPGCGGDEGDAAAAPGTASTEAGGTDRTYRLIAAAPIRPGEPRALLIDFADAGEDLEAHVAETRFDQLAGALTLVVATPAPAEAGAGWDTDPDGDDMALVDAIVGEQAEARCIDQTRIVLAGRGDGAEFAAAYACAHPGEVAGLILVAGVGRSPSCPTPEPFSILAVLGADDPASGPAQEALQRWVGGLGCEGRATQQAGILMISIDTTCREAGELWRVVIPGAAHEWYPATYDLAVSFMSSGPLAPA